MTDHVTKNEWYAGRPFTESGRLIRTGGILTIVAGRIVFKPLFGLGIRKKFDVKDVIAVQAIQNVPPKLQINLRDGSSAVFTVTVSRGTPVWSGDTTARDEAVSVISALIER